MCPFCRCKLVFEDVSMEGILATIFLPYTSLSLLVKCSSARKFDFKLRDGGLDAMLRYGEVAALLGLYGGVGMG